MARSAATLQCIPAAVADPFLRFLLRTGGAPLVFAATKAAPAPAAISTEGADPGRAPSPARPLGGDRLPFKVASAWPELSFTRKLEAVF